MILGYFFLILKFGGYRTYKGIFIPSGYSQKEVKLQNCKSCLKQTITDEGTEKCSCGKKLEEGEWGIMKTPTFEQKIIKITHFPKSYHILKSQFYSLTTTAAARDGHLMRSLKTTRFERSDSIEDKTENKQKFNPFGKGRRDK